jgi:hypothetical protein
LVLPGALASASYDADNRLTQWAAFRPFTISTAATIATLCDGFDAVQEQNGGSVQADLLTGLEIESASPGLWAPHRRRLLPTG